MVDQKTQNWADGGFLKFRETLEDAEPGMPADYYDIKARQIIVWAAVNGYRLESVIQAHVQQAERGNR